MSEPKIGTLEQALKYLISDLGPSDGSHVSFIRATAKLVNAGHWDRDTICAAVWEWVPEATRQERERGEFFEECIRSIESLPPKDSSARSDATEKVRWPDFDSALMLEVLRREPGSLQALREKSHVSDIPEFDVKDHASRVGGMIQVLNMLFPDGPLLHVASTQADSIPMRAKGYSKMQMASWVRAQFTVPSPATAATGKNRAGRPSTRCLDNTGERRFIVIESDKVGLDDQAAILLHLSRFLPLAMVLDSRGKSLHGWFRCAHHTTPDAEAGAKAVFASKVGRFMHYAARLGADPALYTRCQLVRMPYGFRPPEVDKVSKGEHYAQPRVQQVLYLGDLDRIIL